jgi:ABC-type uncharacterized transport system YnjBCD permease subunit
MPSPAKATGAVLLAALALVVSSMIARDLPVAVGGAPARLSVAALGLLVGWRLCGETRGGAGPAAARGITAAMALVLLSLLAAATWEMLERSGRGRYDGPMEALGDVAGLMATYGRLLVAPAPAAVILVGGAAAGVLAGAVGRRWP